MNQPFMQKLAARLIMTLIMIAVTTVGIYSNKLLLWSGLEHIVHRYSFAVIISYAAFLFFMWVWVKFIRHHNLLYATGMTALTTATASQSIQNQKRKQINSGSGSSSWDFGNINLDFVDGDDGVVVFLFIVFLCAIIGASLYAIIQAPLLLDQLLVDVFISSSLLPTAKKYGEIELFQGLIKSTWIPFIIVLVTSLIFTAVAHNYCPQGNTLTDIFGPMCQQRT